MRLRIVASGAVLLLLIVLGAFTAFSLLAARHSLQRGINELRIAQDRLQLVGDRGSLRSELHSLRGAAVRARNDFRAADGRLAPIAPLLERLGWVPQVGTEIAASPHLARAATRTTDGTLSLLRGVEPLATVWDGSPGRKSAPALVQALVAGHAFFARACRQFKAAESSRREVPAGPYPIALVTALHSLDDRLPRLRTLCRALMLAPAFLGAGQPASYLIAYQDSNELRATGGFIGSASLITVRQGVTSQVFQGTGIRDNLSVPPPEPVEDYNREPGWLFRDSNWSPDFPTTAALERFFYQLDFHHDAPNVINLTPQAAADMLSATGPIYVPEYHRLVTGANVAYLADQYAHWAPIGSGGVPAGLAGKQFIGVVARYFLQRATSLSPRAWINLGNAVGTATAHGDLLFNFRNRAQQALLRAAGAVGAVTPTHGDYLYVLNTNLSYNKINPYVHLTTAYDVTIRPDRWLDAHLIVHLYNAPAPPALAATGIGPGAGSLGGKDDYATFLRIYTPPGAALMNQSGWTQPWSSGPAYGGTMFSGYLIVPRGATRTVRLHYMVPPNVFSSTHGTRYALRVPHQPGSQTDTFSVTVRHDGSSSVYAVHYPTLSWRVSVPVTSRPFHSIHLPVLPPPATSPGGWVEPHAFLAAPNRNGG